MSRLIVKNLPKNVTDKKLKEIFSEKGLVTDVQLKYTPDGKFRRFAFVGYKTEEEAAAALEYFNNSCVDTARITVDYCAALGDSSKPQSWSKYAPDSKFTASKKDENADKPKSQEEKKEKVANKKEEKKKIKEMLEKYKDDPLFNEFLDSHSAKEALSQWSTNEELKTEVKETIEKENEEDKASENIAYKNISDKEYMQLLKKNKTLENNTNEKEQNEHGPNKYFTVKVHGLGFKHKKKHVKEFFKPLKPKSIRVPTKIKGIAYVGFKSERLMKQALNKNKSFYDGKRIFVTKYVDTDKNQNNKVDSAKKNLKWVKQEEALKNEECIAESGKMFLRNLTYSTTEDDVKKLFEKYGPLTEVNLPIDKITRKQKGFGVVTFLMPEHATKAYTELDGSIFNGRMLHLLPGKTKNETENLESEDNSGYKSKKEKERKVTAGSSHNWNTLFLGQNAIADAIAQNYNTTKEKVLEDTDETSVAVRLAIGETQLVQETQKFLEENGVCLNAFNQAPKKRSTTVILVKNLPAGTIAADLRELFIRYGELARIILPPSGITALVEFIEPSEARKAFAKLAYTKFKHLPLYLEWAPDDSFTSPPKQKNENKFKDSNEVNVEDSKITTKKEVQNTVQSSEDEEDNDEPEPDTTLFVKNLNFSTTEDQLKKLFSKCGPLHYANITMKKDSKNPGNQLSMGYGFVRYKYKSDAEKALKQLQMTTLDGKTLEIKRSERTLKSDIKVVKKTAKVTEQTGTKILVRNVAFQANENELKELFKTFGELKAVRLPKKLVGDEKHRGFAFIEYFTKKEAKRAFKALGTSTHLYGRRLVLEWAQTDEGIEEIRKRTAKHFVEERSAKKSKKATLDPESIGLETK